MTKTDAYLNVQYPWLKEVFTHRFILAHSCFFFCAMHRDYRLDRRDRGSQNASSSYVSVRRMDPSTILKPRKRSAHNDFDESRDITDSDNRPKQQEEMHLIDAHRVLIVDLGHSTHHSLAEVPKKICWETLEETQQEQSAGLVFATGAPMPFKDGPMRANFPG